jgi:hypothetical protein
VAEALFDQGEVDIARDQVSCQGVLEGVAAMMKEDDRGLKGRTTRAVR